MHENSLSFSVDTTIQRGLVWVEDYNESGEIEFAALEDAFPALPIDKRYRETFFKPFMVFFNSKKAFYISSF